MNDYNKLKDLISTIDLLISNRVSSSDDDYILWKRKVERFLSNRFGEDSNEINSFKKIHFSTFILDDNKDAHIQACERGLKKAKAELTIYLEEIEEENANKLYEKSFNSPLLQKHLNSLEDKKAIKGDKMNENKKYQVFISSTYIDLIEERNSAIQCLLDNNCIPVGMEQFPASNMSQMDYIKKMLDDCDYYILILGGRYGSIDEDGVGFTEKEYDYALSIGIPVLTFVVEDIGKLPHNKVETTNSDKYAAFRDKVTKRKLVNFYNTPDDLKAKILTSIVHCIHDHPAIGWVRGNSFVLADEEHYSEASYYTLSDIQQTENQYINQKFKGSFTFDYSNNDGEYVIGIGDYTFTTKWSSASNCAIHAYKDANDIEAIARIKNAFELPKLLTGTFDFSSRVRDARIGDVIIWRNQNGKYAATRVLSIKCESHGDDHDELSCEYVIYK